MSLSLVLSLTSSGNWFFLFLLFWCWYVSFNVIFLLTGVLQVSVLFPMQLLLYYCLLYVFRFADYQAWFYYGFLSTIEL